MTNAELKAKWEKKFAGLTLAATLKEIGAPLDLHDLSGAVAVAYEGMYYFADYWSGEIFVYCPKTGSWGCIEVFGEHNLCGFAASDAGCFAINQAGEVYRVDGEKPGAFYLRCPHLFEPGDFKTRMARVCLYASIHDSSKLEVCFRDFDRRTHVILSHSDSEGMGGAQKLVSHAFTPADVGGYLFLTGEGNVHIHEILLATQDAGT